MILSVTCRNVCIKSRSINYSFELQFRNQYDSDVTTWSPDGRLHQVEYAMEAVKQGSATVGIKSKTHAVLVSQVKLYQMCFLFSTVTVKRVVPPIRFVYCYGLQSIIYPIFRRAIKQKCRDSFHHLSVSIVSYSKVGVMKH